MGKGNRTRNNQYDAAYAMSGSGTATRRAQKKDNTASIVLIAIAALLVLSLALVVFSDSGVKARSTVIASTENFEITGTSIAYFEGVEYSNMFNEWYTTAYYYYSGGDAQQAYSIAQSMMSNYPLSYFFDTALETAQELLVLCEAALDKGLALDGEDQAQINEVIASIGGNYAANFGSGVKEKDVRAALELQALASKFVTLYADETYDSLSDEDAKKYIEEHKADFYKAHVLKYAMSLKAADYADDEEGFDAAKALVDTYTAKLEAATTVDEFRTAVVEYIVARDFDATAAAKIASNILPDEAGLETIKAQVLETLVDVLVGGKEQAEVVYEAGSLEEGVSKVVEALKSTGSTALAALETTQSYVEETEDEAIKTMINAETALNTTATSTTANDETYSRTVYMLTEALHVEYLDTVNAGHILVSAAKSTAKQEELDAAKAKAEEILASYLAGEKTKDAFEKLGKANSSESTIFIDNIAEGDMVAEFNDWIYDEARQIGDTGIVQTDYGFHVMYWDGEGDLTSIASAKNGLVSDLYDAFIEEGKASITLNEKYIAKHSTATETE